MAAKKEKTPTPTLLLIDELDALTDRLESLPPDATDSDRAKLRTALQKVSRKMVEVAQRIDPIHLPRDVFDVASPQLLGRVMALAMVCQKRQTMTELKPFYGAGVYALYYTGDFAPYAPLSGTEHPIYVGKAEPGAKTAATVRDHGPALYMRLQEHAKKSISLAKTTLKLDDFECRYLVIQAGQQSSAEDQLIRFFRPVWNSETDICHGIGKHGDNPATRANKRSPWDTLHPGRPWAIEIKENQRSLERIEADLAKHFHDHPPYKDTDAIIKALLTALKQH